MSTIRNVDPTVPPSWLEKRMRAFVMSGPGTWLAMKVSTRVDPWLLRATGGRFSTGMGFPVVLLTTRGRKSGRERTVPLVYFTQGDEVILTASSFGRDKHPAWYLNLRAEPRAELLGPGGGGRYVARETEGPERERLFELATSLYRGYGLYAEKTEGSRTIPVLALRAVGD